MESGLKTAAGTAYASRSSSLDRPPIDRHRLVPTLLHKIHHETPLTIAKFLSLGVQVATIDAQSHLGSVEYGVLERVAHECTAGAPLTSKR